MFVTNATRLHVRFEGRSEDLILDALGLTPAASDAELTTALARRYERPADELKGYVVVREPQAIIVRPIAFYG